MLEMFKSALEFEFTPFENLMEKLAEDGRIQRYYTQNIDYRSAGLLSLS